ncbi:Hypp692 [Branchiostoma lanceolatum]|uniref:Hypp692 protein n=1 Tax=Branchiostoma lanceolatum TaxID=7740 RepID=A0A8J9W0S3_BRALA|nr:Hypp692 [Branchiostoma lanceolatum]
MVFNTGSVVILDGRIRVYSGGLGADCGYNKQEGSSSNRPISERFQSALEAIKKSIYETAQGLLGKSPTPTGDHGEQAAGHLA